MSPASRNNRLAIWRDRAAMLQAARAFFAQRKILEVDTPLLAPAAPVDPYVDVIEATLFNHQRGYLHTSPEYAMKALLALGIGDIYQLSHVFRDHEMGERHRPEFMMAEWYRLGFSLEQMIEETIAFVELFVGQRAREVWSYREALIHFADVDYLSISDAALQKRVGRSGRREELLHLLLALSVEPHFATEKITVLTHFPADQAALARKEVRHGEEVALRFELFCGGYELANGYDELCDHKEQKSRLEEANRKRQAIGKSMLPIDPLLVEALKRGLPPCCGVAVGFDRLMMVRHQVDQIDAVAPISSAGRWESAGQH